MKGRTSLPQLQQHQVCTVGSQEVGQWQQRQHQAAAVPVAPTEYHVGEALEAWSRWLTVSAVRRPPLTLGQGT